MSKNFVVAGGSSGIGLKVVQMLSESGHNIDAYSRAQGGLELSDTVRHHAVDFSVAGNDLAELPEEIHGAVYCPGSINLRSFRSLKVDDFQKDLEINLLGAIRFLQACLPGLKKAGVEEPASVVLFSTVAVGQGMSMHASVAAAKGAVEGLCKSLAAEWAPRIRVNCIAPALTDTPLAAKLLANDEKRNAMAAMYPLKRFGNVTDMATAVNFLLSPQTSWITGQVWGIDGGLSALK